MGHTSISLSHSPGDLVFAADKTYHQYVVHCRACDGDGKIQRPEGTGVKLVEGEYEYDEDDEDWLEDDEIECEACNGYGSEDEEVELLYPSLVGRISRISADLLLDLEDEDDDVLDEVNLFIAPLEEAGLKGETEFEEFIQMTEFYKRLRAGDVRDFFSCQPRRRVQVSMYDVAKSYKQLCEHVIKHNRLAFRKIFADLADEHFEVEETDAQELIGVCNSVVIIQNRILEMYPDLKRLVPDYNPKERVGEKSSEKDTEKIEKEDKKPEENKALMALATVEVEEALL